MSSEIETVAIPGESSLSLPQLQKRKLKTLVNHPFQVLRKYSSIAQSKLAGFPHIASEFQDRQELFRHSISEVEPDGLFMEFGVYKGASVNYVASLVPDKIVYGFDSFSGLPEDWAYGYPKGRFRLNELPKVCSNVKLVVGLFQETLEPFLKEHMRRVAFVHMDADLYSSTKYVLFTLVKHNRLQRGTVIQFDELCGYVKWWTKGEYKALLEFVKEFNAKFEYLGNAYRGKTVSLKILRI